MCDGDAFGDCTWRRWFWKFCDGDSNYQNKPWSGRPSVLYEEDFDQVIWNSSNPTIEILGEISQLHRPTFERRIESLGSKTAECNSTGRGVAIFIDHCHGGENCALQFEFWILLYLWLYTSKFQANQRPNLNRNPSKYN